MVRPFPPRVPTAAELETVPPAGMALTGMATEVRRVRGRVAEILALADPSATPEAVYQALYDAHLALTEAARVTAEHLEPSRAEA